MSVKITPSHRLTTTCIDVPCRFTRILNLHSLVLFNTLWLTAIYYTHPVLLMEFIYAFLIYAYFFWQC